MTPKFVAQRAKFLHLLDRELQRAEQRLGTERARQHYQCAARKIILGAQRALARAERHGADYASEWFANLVAYRVELLVHALRNDEVAQ